jgi:hypothetical protein
VTDYPSNPNFGIPLFIGDFFTIAVSKEDVYIAWTDTRLGRLGSPNSCIALARMRPVPYPYIYISPPSGPAGTRVTVMGFNFAPLRDLYIEEEGALITSLVTNEEGRFTATFFIPISGEGTHTIRAMDMSGNVAVATFYTEFGFDNIREEFREGFERSLPEISERLTTLEESLGKINISTVKDLKDLETMVKAEIQGLEKRLTTLEESLGKVNISTIEMGISGLKDDIKMVRQGVEEMIKADVDGFKSSLQGLTEQLSSFEEGFNTQISSLEGLLWFSTTLAVIAIILSMLAITLIFIRYRRRSRDSTTKNPS